MNLTLDKMDFFIQKNRLNKEDFFQVADSIIKNHCLSEIECGRLLAKWYFSTGDHRNCLISCAYLQSLTKEPLFSFVELYYGESIKKSRMHYEENVAALKSYQWCACDNFPDFYDLPNVLICQDETSLFFFNMKTEEFLFLAKDAVEAPEKKEKVILFAGEYNHMDALVRLLEGIEVLEMPPLWMKRPVYVYYQGIEAFDRLIQTGCLKELLRQENVVFFIGWQEANAFLTHEQAILKGLVYRFSKAVSAKIQWEMKKKIDLISKEKMRNTASAHTENIQWYRANQRLIERNVRLQRPRILFITSRFTTILQYHARDCMAACEKLGCEVKLLIEASDIQWLSGISYSHAIHDFRPDIIFVINYFRDKDFIPQEIIHVNWIQDPMSHITNQDAAGALDDNQYILSHFSFGYLRQFGYRPERILRALVPANAALYRPCSLTEDERERWIADVILVANGSCYQTHINLFKDQFSIIGEGTLGRIIRIFDRCYQDVYEEKFVLGRVGLEQYFDKQLALLSEPIDLPIEALKQVKQHFSWFTGGVIFRSVLAEWLIDGGYTNLKLYGRDWGDHPKFKPYAMGVAENGKTLAKIYQSAKIVLGTNPYTTGAARFYECYLSGGFYIANYIPPEEDMVNFRDQYSEGEEVPFYYNRQDLYAKLDYYLNHAAKRAAIACSLREKMLRTSTYDILAKNMLQWLSQKMADREGVKE